MQEVVNTIITMDFRFPSWKGKVTFISYTILSTVDTTVEESRLCPLATISRNLKVVELVAVNATSPQSVLVVLANSSSTVTICLACMHCICMDW